MWLGVIFTFVLVIDALLSDLGVICFWLIWYDIIDVSLGLSWFAFGVVWCLLVWFGVIFTIFGCYGCLIVWFGCDLVLNDLVWNYCGQIISKLVCFSYCWCLIVWFDVIFALFCVNRCIIVWFVCDLVLNNLVWYYWGQVRSDLFCFWCDLVYLGVVLCDLYIIWW